VTDTKTNSAPINDSVIAALSRLVDDSQSPTGSRHPTHSHIEEQIKRAGLSVADPSNGGKPVGKAKRVRAVLHWALENNVEAGEKFVFLMVNMVRGVGGFRTDSPNYVGLDAVKDLQETFRSEGFKLDESGELLPVVLESLAGKDLTNALKAYVRRAQKGVTDAALVTGTGKDLVEAVAGHVIFQKYGSYSQITNFPTLLGQAFAAIGLCAIPKNNPSPQEQLDLAYYSLACAVNRLRNKQGTGHGHPFDSTISPAQARAAVQSMGLVAERLLESL
jgi:hypothetical protein